MRGWGREDESEGVEGEGEWGQGGEDEGEVKGEIARI